MIPKCCWYEEKHESLNDLEERVNKINEAKSCIAESELSPELKLAVVNELTEKKQDLIERMHQMVEALR